MCTQVEGGGGTAAWDGGESYRLGRVSCRGSNHDDGLGGTYLICPEHALPTFMVSLQDGEIEGCYGSRTDSSVSSNHGGRV